MRKKFICGNWKMYKTSGDAKTFFAAFLPLIADVTTIDIGFAPPLTTIPAALEATKCSKVQIGAQNVHWAAEGAFTGETSVAMLKDIGVTFALIGHSERRQYFGETDETVCKRAKAAIEGGLTAVICVGETLAEREAGKANEIVSRQVKNGVLALGPEALASIVVAYEPVWAIGTGRTAQATDAEEMHRHIRNEIENAVGGEKAQALRILYGGSVKPENTAELMSQKNIDGALVGGASLVAETFAKIVQFSV